MKNVSFKREEILGYEINTGIPHLLTREELKLAQKIADRKKEKILVKQLINSFDLEAGFFQYLIAKPVRLTYTFQNLGGIAINTLMAENENLPTADISIQTTLRLLDKISGLKDFPGLNFAYAEPEGLIQGSAYGSMEELVRDIKETSALCDEKVRELRQYKTPIKDFSSLDEEDQRWLREPKAALHEREKLKELDLEDLLHSDACPLAGSAQKAGYMTSILAKEIASTLEVGAKKVGSSLSRLKERMGKNFDKIFPPRYPVFILKGDENKLNYLLASYAVHKIKNDPLYLEKMDRKNIEEPLRQAILQEIIMPRIVNKEIHLDENNNLKKWSARECSYFLDSCRNTYLDYVEKTSKLVDNIDHIFYENFKAYLIPRLPAIKNHSYKTVFRDFFVKAMNNAPEPLHSMMVGKKSLNDKIFTKERVQSIRGGCEQIYNSARIMYEKGQEHKENMQKKEQENAKN